MKKLALGILAIGCALVACGGQPPADEIGVATEKLMFLSFYASEGSAPAGHGGLLTNIEVVPDSDCRDCDVDPARADRSSQSQIITVYNESSTHNPARVGDSIFFTVAGGAGGGSHINCGMRGIVQKGVIGGPTLGDLDFPYQWNVGLNCNGTFVKTAPDSGTCTDEFGGTVSADIEAVPGGCAGFSTTNQSMSWRVDLHYGVPISQVYRHMARDAQKF